jgi:hypothetical protein
MRPTRRQLRRALVGAIGLAATATVALVIPRHRVAGQRGAHPYRHQDE